MDVALLALCTSVGLGRGDEWAFRLSLFLPPSLSLLPLLPSVTTWHAGLVLLAATPPFLTLYYLPKLVKGAISGTMHGAYWTTALQGPVHMSVPSPLAYAIYGEGLAFLLAAGLHLLHCFWKTWPSVCPWRWLALAFTSCWLSLTEQQPTSWRECGAI